MKRLLGVLLIGVLIPNPIYAYDFCRAITIDHTKVPGNLTNYTMLFAGTYPDLKTVGNGGHVNNSNGYDFGFFPNNSCLSGARYNWESTSWSGSSGAVQQWVKLPAVSTSTDTTLYLCYHDTGINTSQSASGSLSWSSDYVSVFHLEEASGPYTNIIGGTSSGTPGTNPSQTAGVIGFGQSFVAGSSNAFITPSLSSGNQFVVASWFKQAPGVGTYGLIAEGRAGGGIYGFLLYVDVSTHYPHLTNTLGASEVDMAAPVNVADGNWHYIVGAYDGSNVHMFVDNTLYGPTGDAAVHTIGTPNPGYYVGYLPASLGGPLYATQSLDELRISYLRSDDSIKTDYANQSNPSTFYTVGAQAAVGACTAGGGPPPPPTTHPREFFRLP